MAEVYSYFVSSILRVARCTVVLKVAHVMHHAVCFSLSIGYSLVLCIYTYIVLE